MSAEGILDDPALFYSPSSSSSSSSSTSTTTSATTNHPSKLTLALEYLDLVDRHPVKMKSVVFHVRRICRDELTRYQLMEDCVGCKTPSAVRQVVLAAVEFDRKGDYKFDPFKETKAKEVKIKK